MSQPTTRADLSKDFYLLLTSYSERCKTTFLDAFLNLAGLESQSHIVTIPLASLGTAYPQHMGNLVLVCGPSFEKSFSWAQYTRNIANALHSLRCLSIHISAALYLYDGSQDPSFEAVRMNVRLLESILGEGFYPRLVIGTTSWDSDVSTTSHGERLEEELPKGVMKGLVDGGASIARINFKAEEASGPPTRHPAHGAKSVREVLNYLVSALGLGDAVGDQTPLILDEIFRLKLPLIGTTAGRVADQQ